MRRRPRLPAAIPSKVNFECCAPPSSVARARTARSGPDARAPRVRCLATLFLLLRQAKTREPLLEPRQPAAAIDQLLRPASPRRVRLRADIEVHGVAGLAP